MNFNINKLMKCPEINNQKSMYEKKDLGLLIKKKEEKKNFKIQSLHFNPVSYFEDKYSKEDKKFMKTNKGNIYDHIAKSNKKENENINYNLNGKKFKLKPLNLNKTNRTNKTNFGGQFLPKVDDILMPSNKITKELIDYNKANTRNTLLNYYNRSKRNVKIINFIKTNSFTQNQNLNQTNKIDSSNESFINNNSNSYNNPNINNNQTGNQEKIIKENKIKNSFSETGIRGINKRNELRKSGIEAYESEYLRKRKVPRSLNYFHDYFFGNKSRNISNKFNNYNLLLNPETQNIKSVQINSSSTNEKNDLLKYNKNKLVFGPLFNQNTTNKKMFKKIKKNIPVKKTKNLIFFI